VKEKPKVMTAEIFQSLMTVLRENILKRIQVFGQKSDARAVNPSEYQGMPRECSLVHIPAAGSMPLLFMMMKKAIVCTYLFARLMVG
jgi:hypothetical protein